MTFILKRSPLFPALLLKKHVPWKVKRLEIDTLNRAPERNTFGRASKDQAVLTEVQMESFYKASASWQIGLSKALCWLFQPGAPASAAEVWGRQKKNKPPNSGKQGWARLFQLACQLMDPDADAQRDARHMGALLPLLVEQRRFEKARWEESDQLNIQGCWFSAVLTKRDCIQQHRNHQKKKAILCINWYRSQVEMDGVYETQQLHKANAHGQACSICRLTGLCSLQNQRRSLISDIISQIKCPQRTPRYFGYELL